MPFLLVLKLASAPVTLAIRALILVLCGTESKQPLSTRDMQPC